MQPRKLYEAIANAVQARLNTANAERKTDHERTLKELEGLLPSGSGFDSGTEIDLDLSTGEKLVLHTSFHHMNEGGMYDGWTKHTVRVQPSFLGGFSISVSGSNRNDIKEYIAECFHYSLGLPVEG